MSLATFRYSRGLTGTFELPTEVARRLVPPRIEPIEVHHGTSVLAVSVTDFSDTLFGPYAELVLAIVVAPIVRAGEVMPQAAFCPYAIGTSSAAARQMVLPQWPLPFWSEDVVVDFKSNGDQRSVVATAGGAAILEMSLYEHQWSEQSQVHQVIALGEGGGAAALMTLRGAYCDHEDGRGSLVLHAHPIHKGLDVGAVDGLPLREVCLGEGTRSVESLVEL